MQIKDIISFLEAEKIPCSFIGDEEIEITGFSSLSNYKPDSFTWIKKQENIPEESMLQTVALVFAQDGIKGNFVNVLYSPESKHAFFATIEHFYAKKEKRQSIGEHTYISSEVKIGKNVYIGHNCTLDGEIVIGDNTVIWNNVTIINKVNIGSNCEIQSGTVIGHDGFGYTEDKSHIKTMVKHFGGVTIGDNVLISSNVCVCRGTIDDTVICDGVKIDNMSHIAHNCYVGKNAAMAFPCWLGGSSKLEENAYLANATIRNQCTVRENGFVGMGAIVTKDVERDTIVIGNPAKPYVKK